MPIDQPSALARRHPPQTRVLIIPGLRDSGHGHWQSWLQTQYKGALRVTQDDWSDPDLDKWADRIGQTLAQHAHKPIQWIAVAHSFGCLALAHHLARQQTSHEAGDRRIAAALMVAPADPVKFSVDERLPLQGLGIPVNLIGSENDPWMPLDRARVWARHWRAVFQSLGQAGHINTESGFGPWPLARYKVDHMIRVQQKHDRLQQQSATQGIFEAA